MSTSSGHDISFLAAGTKGCFDFKRRVCWWSCCRVRVLAPWLRGLWKVLLVGGKAQSAGWPQEQISIPLVWNAGIMSQRVVRCWYKVSIRRAWTLRYRASTHFSAVGYISISFAVWNIGAIAPQLLPAKRLIKKTLVMICYAETPSVVIAHNQANGNAINHTLNSSLCKQNINMWERFHFYAKLRPSWKVVVCKAPAQDCKILIMSSSNAA